MSLVIAGRGCDGIALVGDSRAIGTFDGMNYVQQGMDKVGRLNGVAVGMVGHVDLLRGFLRRAGREGIVFSQNEDSEVTVDKMRNAFVRFCSDGQHNNPLTNELISSTVLTICCHGQYGTLTDTIYTMTMANSFDFLSRDRWVPTGQRLHGGAYFGSRFYNPRMTAKQVAFMAYFCIREVGNCDPSVGGEIGIRIVFNNQCESPTWGSEFEQRYKQCEREMLNWFWS